MTAIRSNHFHRFIEDNLRTYLRTSFDNTTEYPWVTNIRTTKIFIDTFYPQKLQNNEIPQVIIKHPQLNTTRRTFGRDHVEYLNQDYFVPSLSIGGYTRDGFTIYGAQVGETKGYDVTGTVEVETRVLFEDDLDDVQELMSDFLTDYENLRASGLTITSVTLGERTEVIVGNDIFFQGSLELELLSSWQSTEFIVGATITDVSVTVPTIELDGTTSF